MMNVYVAHPSNYDAEEEYAILFAAPKDGPVYDESADAFFAADARRIARLMVAMSNRTWQRAFRDAFVEACDQVEDWFDSCNDDEATPEAFVGEPVERVDFNVLQQSIELAS